MTSQLTNQNKPTHILSTKQYSIYLLLLKSMEGKLGERNRIIREDMQSKLFLITETREFRDAWKFCVDQGILRKVKEDGRKILYEFNDLGYIEKEYLKPMEKLVLTAKENIKKLEGQAVTENKIEKGER